MKRLLALIAALVIGFGMASQHELEIFSWWAGNEAPALEALIELYEEQHQDVEVINATVAGGAGINARAVLKTRMLGGNPPDSFQVHAGQELIGTYVVADRMEDITFLYEEEGLMDVFPQVLLDLVRTEDGFWSVPLNIHRSNVMWFIPSNLEEWGVTAPTSWSEFLATTCPALNEAGVTPLAVGTNWTVQHLWESVALAELGAEAWNGLWDGSTSWTSDAVIGTFDTTNEIMNNCVNDDFSGLSWQQATDRVVNGEAAFNVMGDWAMGYMTITLEMTPEDFGWAASPGTEGTFMLLSDSFGLPRGATHRQNAIDWLRLVGSLEGQDTFNPIKGSIAARLDSDLSEYNAYSQSAAEDYQQDVKVGSLVHGAVAKEAFMSEFSTVIEILLNTGSGEQAANAAAAIAAQTGVGQ